MSRKIEGKVKLLQTRAVTDETNIESATKFWLKSHNIKKTIFNRKKYKKIYDEIRWIISFSVTHGYVICQYCDGKPISISIWLKNSFVKLYNLYEKIFNITYKEIQNIGIDNYNSNILVSLDMDVKYVNQGMEEILIGAGISIIDERHKFFIILPNATNLSKIRELGFKVIWSMREYVILSKDNEDEACRALLAKKESSSDKSGEIIHSGDCSADGTIGENSQELDVRSSKADDRSLAKNIRISE